MNILFVLYGQFPNGGAFINRMLAYSKGFNEYGHSVYFLLLSKQSNINELKKLNSDVLFFDTSLWNQLKQKKNKIGKLIDYFVVIKRAKKFFKNNNNNFDICYTYGTTFPFNHLLGKYAKAFKLKVVNEQTEFPVVNSYKSIFRKLYTDYFLNNISKNFNALVVISETLRKFYSSKVDRTFKVIVVNMIVDPTRFENRPENTSLIKGKYIAYAGRLDGDKDGVSSLIQAFALVSHHFSDYSLVIIADNSDTKLVKILTENIENSIKEKIIFTGRIERKKIPTYLNNAELLCLARPDSLQARGGFPTKLGEYLATGKPVVITNTGEISKFIKDGANGFIAETNEPKVFAQKLDEALSNLEYAKTLGLEGKKLVEKEFNYKVQSKLLLDLFENLTKN